MCNRLKHQKSMVLKAYRKASEGNELVLIDFGIVSVNQQ